MIIIKVPFLLLNYIVLSNVSNLNEDESIRCSTLCAVFVVVMNCLVE